MNIPEKFSIAEEKAIKAKQYYSLLTVDGIVLPDPFELSGWEPEATALKNWPKLNLPDLTLYLLSSDDKDMGRRMLSDYKVGNLYNSSIV